MDEHGQHVGGGCVSTSGIFSVEMEQNIVDDLVSIGSLGLVVPISVKCWMQDDGKENVLPIEIEHNRKGMDE